MIVKKRFTMALLGIDGSGKSTVSNLLKKELERQGYKVRIVPFHRWVFAHKLKRKTGKIVDKGRPDPKVPYEPRKYSLAAIIKPLIALIDNIIFYIGNMPDGKNADIVIFDRFICATQIKFTALNYNTMWLKPVWWNILPDLAVVFDIDEEESIKRQKMRNDPYLYTHEQLAIERKLYLKFADDHDLIVIQNKGSTPERTTRTILNELKRRDLI